MKKILIATFLCFFVLLSCSNDGSLNANSEIDNTDHSAYANFNHYIGINNQTRLVLEGINGAIKISPTNEIAATIAGERKVQSESDADAQKYLEKLKVIFEDRGDEVYVYTDQPANTRARILTVTYNIKVPATWDIDISNMNGGLQIDSLESSINCDIINGSIIINNTNGPVNLKSVNGTISARLSIPDNRLCQMQLTNGTIDLSVPKLTNAILDAQVVNGSVNVTNLTVSNITSSTTSFNGTLGTGTAQINLDAVNGEINVSGY